MRNVQAVLFWIQSGQPLTHDIRILSWLPLRLVTIFLSLILYHRWVAKTSAMSLDFAITFPRPKILKNGWIVGHMQHLLQKHFELLQIASTVKWKHLSIPHFLEAFLQYFHIHWSILNVLKQLEGFAATCQNLQQPPKSLKSAILRQNGYWPLTKTNWNSIPMTSEALRLFF